MKLEESILLLPCHSLEDFPLYHEKETAEGLLAGWSAMWHPALIAECGRTPTWARADSPPTTLANRLIIVPQVCESLLQAGWAARAKNEGAHVVRKLHRRDEVLQASLAALEAIPAELDPDLAADFLALGYCYLEVELLTRQMRYMSNLDEKHLRDQVVAGAQAAVRGDAATAREHLKSCFDVLQEARERFYPAQAYLVDLTLAAPTTLGPQLVNELSGSPGRNLLISGETVAALAAQDAATLAALRDALQKKAVALIGGECHERELPLLPVESVLWELQRGIGAYVEHLGERPVVFGRRRFGLSPVLPQLLVRMGFTGAAHFTLDEGQFPKQGQSKTRWEGLDSSAIECLSRVPLDAQRPETFLSFPQKMGESMDLDHVATVVLAHWPGPTTPWHDDLRRIAAYSPVLGKFVTLTDYLAGTDSPGHLTKFTSDQYRAPYLKQAVIRRQADPLSQLRDHHRRRTEADAVQALSAVAAMLTGGCPVMANELTDTVELHAAGDQAPGSTTAAELDQRLTQGLTDATSALAAAIPRAKGPAAGGYLVANPLSFSRRINLEVPLLEGRPDVGGPVRAFQDAGGRKLVSVDVPAMGFAWVGAGGSAEAAAGRKPADKPMAEVLAIRNEHLELAIDPAGGGIRTLHDFRTRGNRLSQQLAFRLPGPRPKPGDVWRDPDEEAKYTRMRAESIEVTSPGPVLGEITSRGKLIDEDGRELAGFEQRVQVWRGWPLVVLEVTLDTSEEPRADPWNSYYAARFAWADEMAELRRSVSQCGQSTDAKRLEAPHFIEIESEKSHTTILTGGLPYHRRAGPRMLDSLLIVRGETARRFRLGIGIDLAQPMVQALELVTPGTAVYQTSAPPASGASSWLFHVDLKNVVATHWNALVEEGRVVGFRVRLLETAGRAGRARLRAFRPPAQARHVDFLGQTLVQLPVEEDAILVDFTAHEWVQVEARWA